MLSGWWLESGNGNGVEDDDDWGGGGGTKPAVEVVEGDSDFLSSPQTHRERVPNERTYAKKETNTNRDIS